MRISVISSDRAFARMIELELKLRGHTVTENQDDTELFIIDTDTSSLLRTPSICFGRVARSMSGDFLLRPFRMKDLFSLIEEKIGTADDTDESRDEPKLGRDFTVSAGGENIRLSETEYALLALLLDKRGEAVSREEIRQKIFPDAANSNVCEVYIHYLREKIDRRLDTSVIRTVRGKGYMIK